MTTSARLAERAVASWLRRSREGPPGPFPHRPVTRAVAAHGITALPGGLEHRLLDAWDRTRESPREPGGPEWATALWLECLTSSLRDAPSYDAYTMTALFGQWCRLGDAPRRTARLSALLAADLVRHELRRAAREERPAERRFRTAAAARLARQLDAHDGWTDPGATPPHLETAQALRRCGTLLSAGGRGLPVPPALLVESSLPVATAEPDEPLFLRTVQIMELLAEQAACHIGEAHRQALAATPEPAALAAQLRATAAGIAHAHHVFHLVTTIDPAQFAAIRAATVGTGALQSAGFARLERRCRGTAALRPEPLAAIGLDAAPTLAPPLCAALARVTARLETHDRAAAARLRLATDAVNEQWRRWKRTHLGVAKKVIGDVPGTGGTDGVRYLARHLKEPLL
ncbi:hypothetical protein OG422_28450 [Streptomyces sp. NBC_01525]|uniref:hypothetical protein n=1 Tax=Streptomyces sp. NBC_01525 TaxID=2903893 RepID=UPI00386A628F